ncbi:hypothetical protein [Poseidonibacter antarcticus]|uniref:hypothetical protein n=1 Tax=Poseidonibacter antarcticus TaxID=2478538 RepID=UPI000EF4B3D1|nr:hypothetical protein [Poseidonibacter antarcticus]
MKQILLIATVLATSLFANYSYTGENSGKIDMHGGKSNSLLTNKSKFSNTGINSLGSIGIKKPLIPMKPNELIKEQKKTTEKKTDINTTK